MKNFNDVKNIYSIDIIGRIYYFMADNLEDMTPLELVTHIECYADDDELSAVETWAYDQKLIYSEDDCSNRFDDMIKDLGAEQWAAMKRDKPMISEVFNDWVDNLLADGELHNEQLDNYTYVNDFGDIF